MVEIKRKGESEVKVVRGSVVRGNVNGGAQDKEVREKVIRVNGEKGLRTTRVNRKQEKIGGWGMKGRGIMKIGIVGGNFLKYLLQ